jgi:hypothetical protein
VCVRARTHTHTHTHTCAGALPVKSHCEVDSQCATAKCTDHKCCWEWLRAVGATCSVSHQCCSNRCSPSGTCECPRRACAPQQQRRRPGANTAHAVVEGWWLLAGAMQLVRAPPNTCLPCVRAAPPPLLAGCQSSIGYACRSDADCCEGECSQHQCRRECASAPQRRVRPWLSSAGLACWCWAACRCARCTRARTHASPRAAGAAAAQLQPQAPPDAACAMGEGHAARLL